MNRRRIKDFQANQVTENIDFSTLSLPEGMGSKDLILLVRKVASRIGLSNNAVDLLGLYYSTTQPYDWQEGASCKCWMSVQKAADYRGVNPRTIYNYNMALWKAGIISFDDYGNFRRFGFRDMTNHVVDEATFGVNLKPILLRITEFQQISKEIDKQNSYQQSAQWMISALKRKIIDNWQEQMPYAKALEALLAQRTRKSWPIERLREVVNKLEELYQLMKDWLESQGFVDRIDERVEATSNQQDNRENFRQCRKNIPTHINKTNSNFCFVKKAQIKNRAFIDKPVNNEAWWDTPHAILSPPNTRQEEQCRKFETEPKSLQAIIEDKQVLTSVFIESLKMAHAMGIHQSAIDEALEVFGKKVTVHMLSKLYKRYTAKSNRIKNPGGYLRWNIRNHSKAKVYQI